MIPKVRQQQMHTGAEAKSPIGLKILGIIFLKILPIVASLISLLISIFGAPGIISILPPSGYARITSIDPFPSDHLIIPIEWNNTKGISSLIRNPCLYLYQINSVTGNVSELKFTMAGTYENISNQELKNRYTICDSFIIEKQSITAKVIVFHHIDWANETGNDDTGYKFHFNVGDHYKVNIGYSINNNPEIIEPLIDDLTIKPISSGIWDWWYLDT